MNDTIRLIGSHKSIRKYTDAEISDDILMTILETSRWAPSSHNVQAYSIIVVKDQTKKLEISKIAGDQKWIVDCPVFLVFCADLHRLDIACDIHGKKSELHEVENLLVGTFDTALVTQNVMTCAESLGLGGVVIGGIRNDLEKISNLLHLPSHVIPLVGMCLGYPDEAPWQKPRMPLESIIHFDSYKDDDLVEHLEKYDEVMKDYYIRRTSGVKNKGWTELMSDYISKTRRDNIKNFIEKQGIQIR